MAPRLSESAFSTNASLLGKLSDMWKATGARSMFHALACTSMQPRARQCDCNKATAKLKMQVAAHAKPEDASRC
jgi:hypothetical protein